jgi:hypothetical protein
VGSQVVSTDEYGFFEVKNEPVVKKCSNGFGNSAWLFPWHQNVHRRTKQICICSH